MTTGVCANTVRHAQEVLRGDELRGLVDRAKSRGPDEIRMLYRALGQRGLLGTHLPKEYGGAETSRETATAVYEELVHAGVPDTPYVLTVQIVAEFLVHFADEATRRRHLPGICAGRTLASVLYTEPGAGSDLGGLRATATPDGDGYALTGTKVYSLYSDIADIALVAARVGERGTNRYAGITLFLLNMDTAGVSVEKLPSVQDEVFCRVRFRDVALPASSLLGQQGQGWELLADALAIERTGIDHAARAFAWVKPLASALADAHEHDERYPRLGRLAMRTEVALTLSRAVSRATGVRSTALVSTAKCVASQVARDVGVESFLWVPPGSASEADLDSAAREAPGLTLSAGTTEMMREMFLAPLRHGDLDVLDVAANALDRPVHDAASACVAAVLHSRRRPIPDRHHDPKRAAALWRALCDAQLPQLELPPAKGGFGLGTAVGVTVCEALGAHGVEDSFSPGAAGLAAMDSSDTRLTELARGSIAASWAPGSPAGRRIRVGSFGPATGAAHPPGPADGPEAPTELDQGGEDNALLHSTGYLLGAGLSLLRLAVSYSLDRAQFDTRLVERQAVTHPLVADAMELVALRHYLHHAVVSAAAGTPVGSREIRGLHLLTLEQIVPTATHAVQAVGTVGLTGASDIGARYARILQEVRCWTAYDDPWRAIGQDAAKPVGGTFGWLRLTAAADRGCDDSDPVTSSSRAEQAAGHA